MCREGEGLGSDEQEKEALGMRRWSPWEVGKVSHQGCLARTYK